ncbi:MAG: hypothetical protein KKH70_20445 [Gammaproteobacteria bacterium]|nr:hypothetical protein [Gammaproteobacteria bacterium]
MVKIKADDKVEYEKGTKESFTHFELLQKEVEVLKEQVDEIADILNYNKIKKLKEIEAGYFNDEEVFKRLAEDEE